MMEEGMESDENEENENDGDFEKNQIFLISKCRKIVKFIKYSNNKVQKLKEIFNQMEKDKHFLKLKLDVKTRFNSIHLMLYRIKYN